MQQLSNNTTIIASETYLLVLADIIFQAKDFSKVEEQIWKASKINQGLQALQMPNISSDAIQQIIIGLNTLVPIYNQQSILNLTII